MIDAGLGIVRARPLGDNLSWMRRPGEGRSTVRFDSSGFILRPTHPNNKFILQAMRDCRDAGISERMLVTYAPFKALRLWSNTPIPKVPPYIPHRVPHRDAPELVNALRGNLEFVLVKQDLARRHRRDFFVSPILFGDQIRASALAFVDSVVGFWQTHPASRAYFGVV